MQYSNWARAKHLVEQIEKKQEFLGSLTDNTIWVIICDKTEGKTLSTIDVKSKEHHLQKTADAFIETIRRNLRTEIDECHKALATL